MTLESDPCVVSSENPIQYVLVKHLPTEERTAMLFQLPGYSPKSAIICSLEGGEESTTIICIYTKSMCGCNPGAIVLQIQCVMS